MVVTLENIPKKGTIFHSSDILLIAVGKIVLLQNHLQLLNAIHVRFCEIKCEFTS